MWSGGVAVTGGVRIVTGVVFGDIVVCGVCFGACYHVYIGDDVDVVGCIAGVVDHCVAVVVAVVGVVVTAGVFVIDCVAVNVMRVIM